MKRLLGIAILAFASAPAFAADNDEYYVPPAAYYNNAEPQPAVNQQAYSSYSDAQAYANAYYYAPRSQQQTGSQVAPLDSAGIMSSD